MQLIWGKVFKNGPCKICGKQPFKNLKGYALLKMKHNLYDSGLKDLFNAIKT